jgi:hypothetical protein
MTTKLICVLALALLLGACESTSPDVKPAASPTAEATATPAPSPSPQATAPAAWKAGDKVKVTINGAVAEATIVSIDEKAAKATVKVQGETKERTVNLSDLAKQ